MQESGKTAQLWLQPIRWAVVPWAQTLAALSQTLVGSAGMLGGCTSLMAVYCPPVQVEYLLQTFALGIHLQSLGHFDLMLASEDEMHFMMIGPSYAMSLILLVPAMTDIAQMQQRLVAFMNLH